MPTVNYVSRARELFAQYGPAEAVVAYDRRLTYDDLDAHVVTMAATLHEHGIRSGMAVAALCFNPPEALFLQLALHLLGCRSVWIAPNAPGRFQVEYLRLAEVDAFVYDVRTHADLGQELAQTAPQLAVLCLGPGGAGPDLAAAPLIRSLPFDPATVTDEPESLFQTGGTTGRPKLVHHRHTFFDALHTFAEFYRTTDGRELRHLGVSGFWHASSQTAAFITLFTGGTLFLHEGLVMEDFFATVERERITSTLMAPSLLYLLLDNPLLDKTDVSSLNILSVGGSPAAPARMAQALERFGPGVRPSYGMSEATFITAYNDFRFDPEHPERLGSCGRAYGDTTIEIRDDSNTVLGPGKAGEVWVSTALMMSGYWGDPELTRETLVDGWLKTGDVGYLDADGFLFLVDRYKDMIITGYGGSNVYSRPVEDALCAHPAVRAAAVIGVPDERTGEAVHAYVVVAPDSDVSPGDLRAFVVAELNELWAPRTIELIGDLPLTEMGKVDKKALRARYLASHTPA
jgi:acyl-CoA synthetase (AMP-forming)/AMP-acid ligase II